MPIYEYSCKDGHRFDEWREMDQRNRGCKCPVCNKRAKRVLSQVYMTGLNDGPYFDIGLNRPVRNMRHAEEVARTMGLERRQGRVSPVHTKPRWVAKGPLIRMGE
jgi:putative FmdB family regulatory protein